MTSAVRRIAEAYLADLIDRVQYDEDTDAAETATGILTQAEYRLTHSNTRLVLTFDLSDDGSPDRTTPARAAARAVDLDRPRDG